MMGFGRDETGQVNELVPSEIIKLEKLRLDSAGRYRNKRLVDRGCCERVQAWWSDPLDLYRSDPSLGQGDLVNTPPTIIALSVKIERRLVNPTRPATTVNEFDSF
ncbi:hypothetical protein QQ045_014398 [Rhodiola kirilowii]